MATPALTETSHRHQKIARVGQSGYSRTRCCVCSYPVRKKYFQACSQPDCPNVACKDCHSNGPFCCSRTEELRRARNIPHPVTYVTADSPSLTTSQTSLPDHHSQQPRVLEANDNAIRKELLSKPIESLVDIILKQKKELRLLNGLLNEEALLKQRAALVAVLNSIDALALIEEKDSPTHSHHTSQQRPTQ